MDMFPRAAVGIIQVSNYIISGCKFNLFTEHTTAMASDGYI